MIQGEVEVRHAGSSAWVAAKLNETLKPGDYVRTGEHSRAEIYLASGTTVEKGELSEIEIPPGGSVAFRRGIFKVFDRARDQRLEMGLPTATAAIRGTDFLIKVADDGSSEVIVLDGSVLLKNERGEVALGNNERGLVEPGKAPRKPPMIEAVNDLIQWNLYYPAVVDADSLPFTAGEKHDLADSLNDYRVGDLVRAADTYDWKRANLSEAETVYRAELLLSVGQVEESRKWLEKVPSAPGTVALLKLISAVKRERAVASETNKTAAEWLAESYYQQSLANLPAALRAAQRATELAPRFGFAWARLAELEFSFGRREASEAALQRALTLSPRNAQAVALSGFLLAAEGRMAGASEAFDRAITIDSALGNAWLGRGLTFIHARRDEEGLRDLMIAASLEPQRSLLRSYLGKAFVMTRDDAHAAKELRLAMQLDARDPTPWLYGALLEQSQNKINDAVGSLERSVALNDNRAVYRSQLLLDQDRAVRSANLAAVYSDDGMTEISVDEASKSVINDYANYSAHLFLANSYNELRDPNLINLRFETATFSEYLLANLLSPVGGTPLSSYVSQQDYSRLFAQEGPHFSSQTLYSSGGDWQQQASLYGWQKNTSYAVDVYYRSQNGVRVNNGIEQWAVSAELKQQLTPNDSAYVEADFSHFNSGDVRQLYDQSTAEGGLRVTDHQIPNLFLGYHHEWAPGVHTLLLGGRLDDSFDLSDTNVSIPAVVTNGNGQVVDSMAHYAETNGFPPGVADSFDSYYLKSHSVVYSIELQQIAEISTHMIVLGARYQNGQIKTEAEQQRARGNPLLPYLFPPGGGVITEFTANQANRTTLTRLSFYCYDQWHVFDPLWLVGGLSYDGLRYPPYGSLAPISNDERTTSQVSPKAGFIWTPAADTTFRFAFTRSLGGLSYDSSVRLEPVQVAGFDQAYRSVIPESVEGAVPGSKFQTFDLGFEQKFKSRTYLTMQLELLHSDASLGIGAFIYDPNSFPANYTGQTQINQELKYEEHSLALDLDQLAGRDWAFGAHYKVANADLKKNYLALPETIFPSAHENALLQTLDLHAIYNRPIGFFAEAQALWRGQSNYDDDSNLAGDNFWQFNLFAGWRFAHRRMEVTAALLNLTGQNYHLNPLNLYQELPRARTLEVSLTMNF